MAVDNGTGVDAAVQAVLTDDPDFLRDLVAQVMQEMLEADAAQRAPAAVSAMAPSRVSCRPASAH